jgi:hypothetical protein
LAGCGAVVTLGKAAGALVTTPGTITFGNLQVGDTASAKVSVSNRGTQAIQISSLAVSGEFFSLRHELNLPTTLLPGNTYQLTVQFAPGATGAASGDLTIFGNPFSASSSVVHLSGTGMANVPLIRALSCSKAIVIGPGTDACVVTLSANAPPGGVNISLSSTNPAVQVPPSLTVPLNSTSANFDATVSTIASAQPTTLTASTGTSSAAFTLQMSAPASTLTANSATISFGNVALNTPATQSLTLTSIGTIPVTINAATVSGPGFTAAGIAFPQTLSPGQTATIEVQFEPAVTGTANGALFIASNSIGDGTITIPLTGSGVPLGVRLTWDAPDSLDDPIVGYKIYRTTRGSPQYQLLSQSVSSALSFVDGTVQGGLSYEYYVTSVDASGLESTPSNVADVVVPSPNSGGD